MSQTRTSQLLRKEEHKCSGQKTSDMRSLALWDDGGRSMPLRDVSGDEAGEKGSGQREWPALSWKQRKAFDICDICHSFVARGTSVPWMCTPKRGPSVFLGSPGQHCSITGGFLFPGQVGAGC